MKKNPIKIDKISILPIGAIVSFIIINQVFTILSSEIFLVKKYPLFHTLWIKENTYLTNVEIIGAFLYTRFSILFFLCGLILLVAMIGAIVLTMHQRPTVKRQKISTQLDRNPKGVVKFITLRK